MMPVPAVSSTNAARLVCSTFSAKLSWRLKAVLRRWASCSTAYLISRVIARLRYSTACVRRLLTKFTLRLLSIFKLRLLPNRASVASSFKLRLPPVSELRSLQYASFDRFRDSRKSKFVTASLAAGQLPKLRYSSVRYSGFDAFNNSASIAFNDQASFASNFEL